MTEPTDRSRARRRFRGSREGSVAVEFALASSVMLALLAATLDLSYMVDAQRDAERASALLTKTLTTCPPTNSTKTWKGTDCVRDTMQWLVDRMPSVLVGYPTSVVTVGMASIQRVSGAIRMCPGNMTYLESDMMTSALSIMKDDDAGALAYVKITYTPFLPNFSTFSKTANSMFRQYTVDVRGNGNDYQCAT